MLKYSAVRWLISQEGPAAVRARRSLCIARGGDDEAAESIVAELVRTQSNDGSFDASPLKTACVLNLLADLKVSSCGPSATRGGEYLLGVLAAAAECERAAATRPGGLTREADLCGFFDRFEDRDVPEVAARGSREMNWFREYEPLLGAKSAVRALRRSSLDPARACSCYQWGLLPVAASVEALCRSGLRGEARLTPALNALVGAQRKSGGWCRGLDGHPSCTLHALRALAAHPELRISSYAERALLFMRSTQLSGERPWPAWWKGRHVFASIEAASFFDFPAARDIMQTGLAKLAAKQQKNGSFGGPNAVERAAAVIRAEQALTR